MNYLEGKIPKDSFALPTHAVHSVVLQPTFSQLHDTVLTLI